MTASGDTADPILTYDSLQTSDPDEFENPSVQTKVEMHELRNCEKETDLKHPKYVIH